MSTRMNRDDEIEVQLVFDEALDNPKVQAAIAGTITPWALTDPTVAEAMQAYRAAPSESRFAALMRAVFELEDKTSGTT